jgi:fructose-bisphosphate aldolase class II
LVGASEREFMGVRQIAALVQSLREDVRQTREAVEALKAINPAILVDREIGDIGTGSEMHEPTPDLSKGLSTAKEAKQLVESTGVDILAPAVGNMHGALKSMVKGETKKQLDIGTIP